MEYSRVLQSRRNRYEEGFWSHHESQSTPSQFDLSIAPFFFFFFFFFFFQPQEVVVSDRPSIHGWRLDKAVLSTADSTSFWLFDFHFLNFFLFFLIWLDFPWILQLIIIRCFHLLESSHWYSLVWCPTWLQSARRDRYFRVCQYRGEATNQSALCILPFFFLSFSLLEHWLLFFHSLPLSRFSPSLPHPWTLSDAFPTDPFSLSTRWIVCADLPVRPDVDPPVSLVIPLALCMYLVFFSSFSFPFLFCLIWV